MVDITKELDEEITKAEKRIIMLKVAKRNLEETEKLETIKVNIFIFNNISFFSYGYTIHWMSIIDPLAVVEEVLTYFEEAIYNKKKIIFYANDGTVMKIFLQKGYKSERSVVEHPKIVAKSV